MDAEYYSTLCRHHLQRYVRITTTEGKIYDGLIIDVEHQNVILAVSTYEVKGEDSRQVGFNPLRRLTFPLSLLASLFLLLFFGGAFLI